MAARSKCSVKSGKKYSPPPQPPKPKRTLSELSSTSDENSLQILTELEEIKCVLDKTVKIEDLKEIVKGVIQETMTELRKEYEERMKSFEQKHIEERRKLQDQIDGMNLEVHNLRERLSEKDKEVRDLKKSMNECRTLSMEASSRANRNEQYSRKTNVKIYGITETLNENIKEKVKDMMKTVAKIEIKDDEIMALHRIPGKPGETRPIIMKVKNTEIKSKIMKKRKIVRQSGNALKISDDVTAANTKLIQRLGQFEDIQNAWYFNGSVYGQLVNSESRIRFDIHDNLDDKIKRSVRKS
ncbi:uncharacterized protein LOC106180601 [Lingula anatina]|uniref:Uncharacterized protein LOC106180601 n=1 Tax=Lingula anatina TaxID=7574 RepID=A0A1S3KBR4_LINAN|nr:uncharacterized protein LOC106180601 [Lingula anatina]|eukprot:XP_013420073.1 uncharacterized protein LOC106180601 [Lingula anatina]